MFLAQLWAHRMTFLYHSWLTSGREGPLVFTPMMLAAHELPAELETFLRDAEGATLARAVAVRRTAPGM